MPRAIAGEWVEPPGVVGTVRAVPAHDRLQHTNDGVGHRIARSHAEHAVSERFATKHSRADVRERECADDVSSGAELIAGIGQGVERTRSVPEAGRSYTLVYERCARHCEPSSYPEGGASREYAGLCT